MAKKAEDPDPEATQPNRQDSAGYSNIEGQKSTHDMRAEADREIFQGNPMMANNLKKNVGTGDARKVYGERERRENYLCTP